MSHEIEPVLTGQAELGEGPVWDARDGVLLWLDILRSEVHRFDPGSGVDTAETYAEPVTAVVPSAIGAPVAAIGSHVARLDHPGDTLATLPTGDRANDGACDPAGRFLVGTLTGRQVPGACALYRVDGPGRVTAVVPGVTVSNGLDWSPAGDRMYFTDTPTRRVDVFDYDPATGSVAGRRVFADLADAPGRPDGLTVDSLGGVWVALVRGGQIRRYDEHGRLDAVIALPASRVTSCAFGGPRLDELYVTSGRFDMSDAERAQEPLGGALFRLRPGVAGIPARLWNPPVPAARRE